MELKKKITSTPYAFFRAFSHILSYLRPSLAFTKFVSIGYWPAQFFVCLPFQSLQSLREPPAFKTTCFDQNQEQLFFGEHLCGVCACRL